VATSWHGTALDQRLRSAGLVSLINQSALWRGIRVIYPLRHPAHWCRSWLFPDPIMVLPHLSANSPATSPFTGAGMGLPHNTGSTPRFSWQSRRSKFCWAGSKKWR